MTGFPLAVGVTLFLRGIGGFFVSFIKRTSADMQLGCMEGEIVSSTVMAVGLRPIRSGWLLWYYHRAIRALVLPDKESRHCL